MRHPLRDSQQVFADACRRVSVAVEDIARSFRVGVLCLIALAAGMVFALTGAALAG